MTIRLRRPVPPENVQVVLRNGQEIPVECVYAGIQDGVHMWEAVYPMPDAVVRLSIDMLPARTGIRVAAPHR